MIIFRLLSLLLLPFVFVESISAKTLKIATVSPEGSSWIKFVRNSADEINKLTDGRVKFKFYLGGVSGNDQAVFRKIKLRQLHGIALTLGSVTQVAEANMYSLPMLFDDMETIDLVRPQFDPYITEALSDKGWSNLGIAFGGFSYLLTDKPISSLKEAKSLKVWLPKGDVLGSEILTTLGIKFVPLSISDVLLGLQSGIIDSLIVPPTAALAFQWFPHFNSVLEVPFFAVFGTLIIDSKVMRQLKKSDQKIVEQEMRKAFEAIDKDNRATHHNALAALKAQGVKPYTLKGKQLDKWEVEAKNARTQITERDQEFLDSYSIFKHILQSAKK